MPPASEQAPPAFPSEPRLSLQVGPAFVSKPSTGEHRAHTWRNPPTHARSAGTSRLRQAPTTTGKPFVHFCPEPRSPPRGSSAQGFDVPGSGSRAHRVSSGNARYSAPTPIQRDAIPHALEARDLLACAQTGTGKDRGLRPSHPRRAPTASSSDRAPPVDSSPGAGSDPRARRPDRRELPELHAPGPHPLPGRSSGASASGPRSTALRRGVDVLVATPGRLLDLMADGEVDLSRVETFVLDEADRMLDMGFLPDVRRIGESPFRASARPCCSRRPSRARSASSRSRLLYEPVEIAVAPVSSTRGAHLPVGRTSWMGHASCGLLLTLLESDQTIFRALVFTRTKRRADRLARSLAREGIEAAAIHGDKSQSVRVRTLESFRARAYARAGRDRRCGARDPCRGNRYRHQLRHPHRARDLRPPRGSNRPRRRRRNGALALRERRARAARVDRASDAAQARAARNASCTRGSSGKPAPRTPGSEAPSACAARRRQWCVESASEPRARPTGGLQRKPTGRAEPTGGREPLTRCSAELRESVEWRGVASYAMQEGSKRVRSRAA